MKHSDQQIVTCLIGDPVDHSVSDILFGYYANVCGLKNYHHLKFKIEKEDANNLKVAIQSIRVLGISGANITLPYKEDVVKYLDEVDGTAMKVGAVNTIANINGKLTGHNTDGLGALRAIDEKLKLLKGKEKVLILGAGGAARAIVGSIGPRVGEITLLNRDNDFDRANKLKIDLARSGINIEVKILNDVNIVDSLICADIVINATSVGMHPDNSSLITQYHFDEAAKKSEISSKVFFDVVFNPFITEFLALAEKNGSKICPGIYMMIYQGIEAFRLWTGKIFPSEEIENAYKLMHECLSEY